jgi:2-keto-4-pentenoate hydratase
MQGTFDFNVLLIGSNESGKQLMNLANRNPQASALELVECRDLRRPIAPPPLERSVPDLDAAYVIQQRVERLLAARSGETVIGYKIAATNAGARANLKVNRPFFGRLFQSITDQSPAHIDYLPDFYRAYEPEIAIQIGQDLSPADAPYDATSVMEATRAVLPAIEIIGTCFQPWISAGGPNLAADNAAHGRWIIGRPSTDFCDLDLLDQPVTLSINGEVVATGMAQNVDGGPFGAAAWLANTLAEMGRTLNAGDYITTGSVTAPYPVKAGERVVASFGPLGTVEITVV